MKLFYLLKVLCYTGLGIVLHLADIGLHDLKFWAVIFLALAIDLLSGWFEIAKLKTVLDKGSNNGTEKSPG